MMIKNSNLSINSQNLNPNLAVNSRNLQNNKANIKIANANGQTPVHIAASYCQDHIVWAHLLRQTSNLSSFNIPDHKSLPITIITIIRVYYNFNF